jgi:hypothetical protein
MTPCRILFRRSAANAVIHPAVTSKVKYDIPYDAFCFVSPQLFSGDKPHRTHSQHFGFAPHAGSSAAATGYYLKAYGRALNGSKAMLRACLIATDRRR